MKFSIIIPSFGQAQYLEYAIRSALGQTYKNTEVIVIDDGSTDGSLEIAKKYEPRIKVISQINKGLASARNTGIMNATGDYIFPLDADDIMFNTCLERVAEKIDAMGADVVGVSLRCFVDGTEQYKDTILKSEPVFEDFKDGNRLAYCAAVSKDALLETGGYSPKMDALGGWEDMSLWYDLMRRGKKIVTIQEPLVMYRVKEQSMWIEAKKNSKALWKQIVKDFPEAKDHVKS